MNLSDHGPATFAAIALALGGLVGCFTGDGLFGQPCRTDDDCNAIAGASRRTLTCNDGVCGAVCGDGVQVDGVEACDDGNADDTDDCVRCELAVCGDAVTRVGVEECDDGNDLATDACNGCTLPWCGDGVVWVGQEECDDGDDTATCAACRTVACGDGRLDPATEVCDDGDLVDDDACSARCEAGAEAIAAGMGDHTCALREAALRCWGSSLVGQLGYASVAALGDEAQDLPPRDLLLGADVRVFAVGGEHTCAALGDGDDLRCWGSNASGQLGLPGLGPIGDELGEPLGPAVAVGGPVRALVAGVHHTCARLLDGAVRCWGDNTYGQLGHPGLTSIGKYERPVDLPPLALPEVQQLSAGGTHTCAVLAADRSVLCWGRNFSFQLGFPSPGTVVSDPTLAETVPLGGLAVAQVSAGSQHTCVVLAGDRSVRCWGGNRYGEVGHDGVLSHDVDNPTAGVGVVDLGGRPAEQVHAGASNTCAVVTGGEVWCWGRSHLAAAPDDDDLGPADPTPPPTRVALPGVARDVVPGAAHTCVRLADGGVHCWGRNFSGQLGLGHVRDVWPGQTSRALLYPTLAPEGP